MSSALAKTSISQNFSKPLKLEQSTAKNTKHVTLVDSMDSSDDDTFGMPHNLDLKISQNLTSSLSGHSEALIDHLNQQIRELKDEVGRLYKLVSERELELRRLKQKREEEQMALSSVSGLAGDTATAKIVELSKKVRELTAELESEKTKSKLANKQYLELKSQLERSKADGVKQINLGASSVSLSASTTEQVNETDIKTMQEKIKQLELKLSEYRNQCQSLRQEIKLAQKVLAQEVGEGVTFQSLMSGSSGWRGRAQQIIQLQKKVNELKSQLEKHVGDGDENLEVPRLSTGRHTINDRNKEHIRKIEKDQKENLEKLTNEMKVLEANYEAMKTKADASKARNSVLSNELKTVKQQLQILTQKGEHDDQLIQALLKKQSQLNELVENGNKRLAEATERCELLTQQMTLKQQQEATVVDQLKTIISEKQAQISQLEESGVVDTNTTSRSGIMENSVNRSIVGVSTFQAEPSNMSSDGQVFQNQQQSSRLGQKEKSVLKKPSSRPSSSLKSDPVEEKGDLHEMKCLYQVVQVERDRLLELSQTLQKRINEVTESMIATQTELSQQRRSNAVLEKQVERMTSEQSKSGGEKGKQSKSAGDNRMGDTGLKQNKELRSIDELERSLAVKSDENEALRVALQSTLQAKEEDMKLYQTVIDEAKAAFLLGLRHMRQQLTSANS